jgi:teichoic acid transport system permease protein
MWQVLTPLTNAAVYYLIFGVILDSKRGVHNFIAYLCIGVFFFTFTSQSVQQGVTAITKNIGLVRVLQFPRASLPISSTISQLQNLLASLVVLVFILLVSHEPVKWSWLLVAPVLVLQAIFNAGLALAFARIGNKVTDLKQVIPFVMRVWMYCSGILYAATNFTEHLPKLAAQIALINPLVVYLEITRQSLLSHEKGIMTMPWSHLWFYAIMWTVVIGIGGFIYFWRGEQEYGRG